MNAFSIWMISTLISTIMNPGKNTSIVPIKDISMYDKLEALAYKLIGNGFTVKVIEFILSNISKKK